MGSFTELMVLTTLPQAFLPRFLPELPRSVLYEVEGMETEWTVLRPWSGQVTVVRLLEPQLRSLSGTWSVCLGVCLFANVRVDRVCPSLSCCGLVTMTHKLTITLCWTDETCLSPGWVMQLSTQQPAAPRPSAAHLGSPPQPAPSKELVVQFFVFFFLREQLCRFSVGDTAMRKVQTSLTRNLPFVQGAGVPVTSTQITLSSRTLRGGTAEAEPREVSGLCWSWRLAAWLR